MPRPIAKLSSKLMYCLLFAALIGPKPATAGSFQFEIPELLGRYLGEDPTISSPVNVAVDLEREFLHIESASLQLTGTLVPGLWADLNYPGEFPLPANIFGGFRPEPDVFSIVYVERNIPAEEGPFLFDESFRRLRSADGSPDFSLWRDGTANFEVSIGTPPMIATTYIIEMPELTIESASLIIHGEPRLEPLVIESDFNGDGIVDAADLAEWESGFGNQPEFAGDDFLAWQRQYDAGTSVAGAAQVVPEPASFTGWLLALLVAARSTSPRCRTRR